MATKKSEQGGDPYAGCYGSRVSYRALGKFLKQNFALNASLNEEGHPRFAQCIWGHRGVGKTSIVKEFNRVPVEFNGTHYDGYHVVEVPIAQIEEMGDFHGVPIECFLMRKGEKSQWVPYYDKMLEQYRKDNWVIDESVGLKTRMAPPDWVPVTPRPTIILLDDWNRSSLRILKGCMQLLQSYGMISWSLPEGCNIVLTGNPDGNSANYLVTTIDDAQLTRIKHITLVEQLEEWVNWAEANGLDGRGLAWLIMYPEMFDFATTHRTNPRTIAEFFRYLKMVPDLNKAAMDDVRIHAESLLDDGTVTSFITFCLRDGVLDKIVEPGEILNGDVKKAQKQITKLMSEKEPRSDILGVVLGRLSATLVDEKTQPTKNRISNFQTFLTTDCIPGDMQYALLNRLINGTSDVERIGKWIVGNAKLSQLARDSINLDE